VAVSYRRSFATAGLAEDAVLAEITVSLDLRHRLSGPAYRIFAYAFTEMLNNAIEHSHSARGRVEVTLAHRDLTAAIRDVGVGVFASVARRMGLKDEADAVGEILKGKATTMPDRHSGEGIFFTSRACDRFSLRSHRIELLMGALAAGAAVTVGRPRKGTEVRFAISRAARRELAAVFAEFSPEAYDYRFERSAVTVRLAARDYVSRSEARRLLARLDEFREVVLDFAGVHSIGQAFADEIFRVFRAAHPRTILTHRNLEPALEAMVRHVVDNRNEPPLTTG
jgi:anti-sigma regulatory factor (Ser/Thr protein kinase)